MRRENLAELAQALKPYIAPWIVAGAVSISAGTGGLSAHALSGSYHTGTLARSQAPWVATDISSAISAHTALTDAHHAKQHGIVDGTHHTVTGSAWDVVGLNGTNALGVLGSSSNPGVAEKLLRTAADGSVNVVALISAQGSAAGGAIVQGVLDADTSYARAWMGHNAQWDAAGNLWTMDWIGANDAAGLFIPNGSASIDLIFHPSSGAAARTMTHSEFVDGRKFRFTNAGAFHTATAFSSGFTGSGLRLDDGVSTAGKTTLELDEMIVRGRMRVYELLIHQIRATNGSLFVSGVGKVKTVSGSGPYTIVTDTDHGFAANDLIRAQRFTGSGVYQSNMQVTSVASSTQFTATLSSGDAPAVGMEFVRLGNTSDTDRQGSIYLTADDTYAPYIDILDGVSAFAEWGAFTKIKVRLGRLAGITDVTLNPTGYGLYSQNAYLKGTVSAANDVVRLDDNGVQVKATTNASFYSTNAYRLMDGSGAVEMGGVYGRDYSSAYTIGLQVYGDASHSALVGVGAKGANASGAATAYIEARNNAGTKVANITLDVTNSASYILLGAADYTQFNMETRSIGGHRPLSDLGSNLGTASYRWGTLYVNQIIAGSVSGTTMSGAEWEYLGGNMVIDANGAAGTVVSIVNQGAGTASLDVENNITLGGTVDGVDVAAFKSSYDSLNSNFSAHIANANAHHAQSHVLATTSGLGGDHTVSGLTTGQVLRATGATTAQFMTLSSGDITTALTYTPVDRAGDTMSGTLNLNGATNLVLQSSGTNRASVVAGANTLDINPLPDATGAINVRLFRLTNTSGSKVLMLLQGDNSTTVVHQLAVTGTSIFNAQMADLDFNIRGDTSANLFYVDASADAVGFGTASPALRVEVLGSGGYPATSGTAQTGIMRLRGAFNNVLDIGQATTTPYGVWLQATDATNLSVEYPLLLNPNGGNVIIGGTANASYTLDVNGTLRASTSVTAPLLTTASGNLTLNSAGGSVVISNALVGANWDITNTGIATMATSVKAPLVTAASGNLTVSAPATLVLNAATANSVELQVNGVSQWSATVERWNPRSTIVMDIGDYNRKVRTLHAAEMYVETLVAQDVMATLGGRVMVAPTTTLIADLSNSAPSALFTNLISYWKLDEASGSRADSKGSNTLTDTNTVTSVAGKQSNAAQFTKANSEYLTAADNSSLSVGDIDFYFSCWIYPTLNDASDQYIAAKGGSSGNRAWELRIDWVNARLRWSVYNSSDVATTVNSANSSIAVNTWHFVECWHDSVGNVIGVAINGTSVTAAHTTGVKDDTGPFQLGARNASGFYQGNIDEFGFWKYMPSSGDRTFLYYSGIGRTYANISDWTTIDVKHNSLTAGTYIYMQAAPGGVPQVEALQVTANGSAVSGGYRYPVIRNLDGTGNNTWVAGDALVSLGSAVGQGYIDLTSTATIHNQYGPTITIFARTSTATWNGTKPVVTMGNLRSFVDYSGDEYGQAGGNDLTLNPASGFAGYTIDRTNGLRLFNTDLRLYSGATEAIRLNNSVGLRFVTGSAAINTVAWYNAIGGYDQAYLYGDLISGTASLNLRARAKDVGTGAFSGYADVILSNTTTSSSIKLLAYDGSMGGQDYYMLVSNTGVTVNALPFTVNGPVSETALGVDNVRIGVNGGAPRIMFEDAGSTQWAIDNLSGEFRFYTPGVLKASINSNGTISEYAVAGNIGLVINTPASQTQPGIYLTPANGGSSYGPFISIDRNNNGSTPSAGWIRLVRRDGNSGDLWVDVSGNLRIGVNSAVTNSTDAGGTVVGTQTSSLDSKNIIEPFTDYGRALNAIIDAPLFDFTYKSGAFGGQRFTGMVTDYAPTFGMDRDEAHPAGKSLNEITAHGYTFAAIKALHARIGELENQVRMLTHAS